MIRSSAIHWEEERIYLSIYEFTYLFIYLVIYLGSHDVFITVQVISQQVVLWGEETSAYSWSRICTVNCRPSVISNYNFLTEGLGFKPISEVGGKYAATAPQCTLSREKYKHSLLLLFPTLKDRDSKMTIYQCPWGSLASHWG